MLVRREMLRLLGLMIATVVMEGCVLHSLPLVPEPSKASGTLRPSETATLWPTKTEVPTATNTESPTPEIVMHAGIPATLEQCDVLHPNTPGYDEEMRQRRAMDKKALELISGEVVIVESPVPIQMWPEQLPSFF